MLSGGGTRAAYQAGALRALLPHFERSPETINIIVGSSIGAINGLVLGAALKKGYTNAVSVLYDLWHERRYENTFAGSKALSLFRAMKVAIYQFIAPGPHASQQAVFDPTPLINRIDAVIQDYGGLQPDQRAPFLQAIAVMTTIEGEQRKPLLLISSHKQLQPELVQGATFEALYLDNLSARHGLASAALPAVLPPVEFEAGGKKITLVDGGIAQNVPIDPCVRFGAAQVISIDVSGRNWWLERYGKEQDSKPSWEIPADLKTFCLRPPLTFSVVVRKSLGTILKQAAGNGKHLRKILGALWPAFTILKNRVGEEIAYEIASYGAVDPDYIHALVETGYNDTLKLLRDQTRVEFSASHSFDEWAKSL